MVNKDHLDFFTTLLLFCSFVLPYCLFFFIRWGVVVFVRFAKLWVKLLFRKVCDKYNIGNKSAAKKALQQKKILELKEQMMKSAESRIDNHLKTLNEEKRSKQDDT